MKRIRIVLIALLLCLVGSLAFSLFYAAERAPEKRVYEVGVDPLPYSDREIYEQLFDLSNKVQVDIQMSEAELQKLEQDYEDYLARGSKSPIYRLCDVTITITTDSKTTVYKIPEVGVRMKGNTSRTWFYDTQSGIYNHIHLKLDFQETFDDEAYYGSDSKAWPSKEARKLRKNRTFAMLEKLDLRWNKCGDSTYLKEAYAYRIYEAQGVPAPRVGLCSLDWSGSHMGVYTICEPVDELFLQKRLPQEDLGGDLYKLGWSADGANFTVANYYGVEDEDKGEFYAYDLKTNKKTSDHSALLRLITELNSGEMTKERFGQLVDIEPFLRYAAVSYFLGNPDDLRNGYNNSYIYFLKSSGKMIVIPYDTDRCLGVVYEWDPTGNGVTADDPFTLERAAGGYQRSPLYLYSIVKGGWYVPEFSRALEEVAAGELLQPDTFEALYRQVEAIYGADAQPSRPMNNSGGRSYAFSLDSGFGGNWSFRSYMAAKMEAYRSPADNTPILWNCYIRASFCDWEQEEAYRMQPSGAGLTIDLRCATGFEFKIYDADTQVWYGAEIVTPQTDVAYTASEKHNNVVLPAGSYRLHFDPITRRLTIKKL